MTSEDGAVSRGIDTAPAAAAPPLVSAPMLDAAPRETAAVPARGSAAPPASEPAPVRGTAAGAGARHRRGARLAVAVVAVVALGTVAGLMLRRSGEPLQDASGSLRQAIPTIAQPAAEASPPAPAVMESPPAAPATGTVTITTVPAHSRVEMDGTPMGVSPLTVKDVKPGRHTVRFTRAGYRTVSRDFEVPAGETFVLEVSLSAIQTAPGRRRPAAPPLPPPPPP